jgi:hypothetical protein
VFSGHEVLRGLCWGCCSGKPFLFLAGLGYPSSGTTSAYVTLSGSQATISQFPFPGKWMHRHKGLTTARLLSLLSLLCVFFLLLSSFLHSSHSASTHTNHQTTVAPQHTDTKKIAIQHDRYSPHSSSHKYSTPIAFPHIASPQRKHCSHIPQWSTHCRHHPTGISSSSSSTKANRPTSTPRPRESDQSSSAHRPLQFQSSPKNSTSLLLPILKSTQPSNNTYSVFSSSNPSLLLSSTASRWLF